MNLKTQEEKSCFGPAHFAQRCGIYCHRGLNKNKKKKGTRPSGSSTHFAQLSLQVYSHEVISFYRMVVCHLLFRNGASYKTIEK